jgi:hypothetical protein
LQFLFVGEELIAAAAPPSLRIEQARARGRHRNVGFHACQVSALGNDQAAGIAD